MDKDILYIELMNDADTYKKFIEKIPAIKKAIKSEYWDKSPGFLGYSGKEILSARFGDIVMTYVNKTFDVIPFHLTHPAADDSLKYFVDEIKLGNF